ncbi:hypothetical protein ACLOJK_015616 [Asimina triloba]
MEKKVAFSLWVMCMVLVVDMSGGHVSGLSCGDAVNALIPCGSFLIGAGAAQPGKECCQSAQSLNKMSTTAESRKALCQCLKDTGPSFGVKPERAKKLPTLCKLKLNIPISPNVDCNR